ncbi:MAG: SDR family oxidoreductase [bacterium]
MDLELENRIALVAASSRGLGKAVAEKLSAEGVKLVVCARNKKILEKTAEDIFFKTGVSVFPLAADLSQKEQIDWLVRETIDLFGKIDILITNAGGPPPGNFDDIRDDEWAKGFELTLMSAVRLIKAIVPGMKKQKWGRIINLTSVSVKQPVDGLLLSNVIRPGVVGLTKSLSQELASYNILVNSVCPGYHMTDRVKQLMQNKAKVKKISVQKAEKEITDQIPLRRMGEPKELADVVTFLASERASYVTGTIIQVDGGYVKGLL